MALGLAIAVGACADPKTAICNGQVVNNTCIPWPAPDAVHDDTGQIPPDVGPKDTGGPPVEDVVEENCLPAVEGVFPVGSACSMHCECSTGYCYDEAYLGDFRFCSKLCADTCSDEDTQGLQSHVCLQLGGKLANEYGLTQTSICMRVCETLEDCKALSSLYDKCGEELTKETRWDGTLIAAQRTCQIAAEVN
jgi:hypothetical protein